MSNIDKQALREAAEKANPEQYGYYLVDAFTELATPTTVLALLDELEAKDKQIADLSSLQGKPIAWESTTPVYVKFITDERYQRLRPGYKKWYKPYRCSQCAAAGKGE